MQYIKQILSVFTVGLILFTMYTQNEKISEMKKEVSQLKLERDSLQNDLFITKTIVGRYELTLDHLKEIDKKSFNKLETYMEKEVE